MSIKIIKYAIAVIVFMILFFSAQRLFMPKHMSETLDGALIAEYYQEVRAGNQHSVIFIGDCEVYQNFSPAELFREYGITSYIRGGASQTVWQSYWLLKETLKYETPQVVIFSVISMGKGDPVSEPYNRLNIDGMRLSAEKLGAASSSMVDGESKISYIFPILRYHDRWRELTSDDFFYFWGSDNVGLNGFFMRSETVPAGVIPTGARLADYTLPEVCFDYLDKMRLLCEENGIEFILVKAPVIWPYWYEQWDKQIFDYAELHSLRYYNLLNMFDETGIDLQTDTPNGGLHMNVHGAEKLSRWLGQELTANFDIADERDNPDVLAVWEKKLTDYDELKTIQLHEFEKYGEILKRTYKRSG